MTGRTFVRRVRVCRDCGAEYASGAYTLHGHASWAIVWAVRHCGACSAVSYVRTRRAVTLYATARAAAGIMIR